MVLSNGKIPFHLAKQLKPNFISLYVFTVDTERVSDNSDGVPDKCAMNSFFLKFTKYSHSFNIRCR